MSFMLYHGSPSYFDYPDVSRGKNFRDFGVGFYLAENEIDALTIAMKDSWDGYLYTYEVNDNLFDVFSVHEFDGFDDDWLEFVYLNRMGHDVPSYDIVIGPTAGGTVNDLFDEARKNNTSFEEIRAIMMRGITDTKFGYQWCVRTPSVFEYMTKVDEEYVTR